MSPSRLSHRLVPVALASLLAVGCSDLPTQPVADSATPGMNHLRSEAASPARIVPPPPTDNPLSSYSQARIKGNRGGVVTAGMFTAVIPAGAFSGFATVSIRQPDPSLPVAVLEIFPESKNNFHEPVMLVARLSGIDASLLPHTGMSELDQSTGNWIALSGEQANEQAMTLSAPLMHFSTYRVEIPTSTQPGGGGGSGSGGGPGKTPTIQE